jgi:hypothetical protein
MGEPDPSVILASLKPTSLGQCWHTIAMDRPAASEDASVRPAELRGIVGVQQVVDLRVKAARAAATHDAELYGLRPRNEGAHLPLRHLRGLSFPAAGLQLGLEVGDTLAEYGNLGGVVRWRVEAGGCGVPATVTRERPRVLHLHQVASSVVFDGLQLATTDTPAQGVHGYAHVGGGIGQRKARHS